MASNYSDLEAVHDYQQPGLEHNPMIQHQVLPGNYSAQYNDAQYAPKNYGDQYQYQYPAAPPPPPQKLWGLKPKTFWVVFGIIMNTTNSQIAREEALSIQMERRGPPFFLTFFALIPPFRRNIATSNLSNFLGYQSAPLYWFEIMHFTDSPRQDWYCNCADGLAVWTSPSGEEVHYTELFSRDPEAWAMMSALQQRTSGYGLEDQEAHGNHGDGDCGCYHHDYRSAYHRQRNGEGRCLEMSQRVDHNTSSTSVEVCNDSIA